MARATSPHVRGTRPERPANRQTIKLRQTGVHMAPGYGCSRGGCEKHSPSPVDGARASGVRDAGAALSEGSERKCALRNAARSIACAMLGRSTNIRAMSHEPARSQHAIGTCIPVRLSAPCETPESRAATPGRGCKLRTPLSARQDDCTYSRRCRPQRDIFCSLRAHADENHSAQRAIRMRHLWPGRAIGGSRPTARLRKDLAP